MTDWPQPTLEQRHLEAWSWALSSGRGLPCRPRPASLLLGTVKEPTHRTAGGSDTQAYDGRGFLFLYLSTFSLIQMCCLNDPDIQKKPTLSHWFLK